MEAGKVPTGAERAWAGVRMGGKIATELGRGLQHGLQGVADITGLSANAARLWWARVATLGGGMIPMLAGEGYFSPSTAHHAFLAALVGTGALATVEVRRQGQQADPIPGRQDEYVDE
jgi:hypothetical protein